MLSGLRIWHCPELWHRLAAAAPIKPLAWEPPYAAVVALKKTKKTRHLHVVTLHTKNLLKTDKRLQDYDGTRKTSSSQIGSSHNGSVVNKPD